MEITIEQILAVLSKSTGKKMAEIKKAVQAGLKEEVTLFDNFDKQIETVIRLELKNGNQSQIVKTKDGKYKRKSAIALPNPTRSIDKSFEGAAGETAVISELLFREFNANRMMVDKGIDVVATKDNVYRYIQVKTSNIKEGRINWQIKQERFDAYVVNNLRYILVARYEERFKYKDEPIARNMFFVLSSEDIERGINQGWINKGVECLSIKVRFDTQTGVAKFYDNKEEDATYYLNKFDKI
ncbi:MAG: hypothetical protein J6V13_03760 [Paludibacteraceae bacterium]|nr:hypothetical protein [Paludibacteraceae bacterium]